MSFSNRKKSVLSLFVFLITALGNAGSTLYLPALISIGHDLHASNASMKFSLSVYLSSIGISQLFYGPLSDAFGRRINLLIGLLIFLIGSLCILFIHSSEFFIGSRIIQGLGIGAANGVGFALLRDLYSGKQLIRQMSYLTLFVGVTPIIAPVIGGYLVTYMGWKSCFVFLSLVALVLWIAKYIFLQETNLALDSQAYHPKVILRNFCVLLKNIKFVGFIFTLSIGFATLLTLNTILPFIFMNVLEVSPQMYGWLVILIGVGYISGAMVGGQMAIRFGISRILVFSILIEIIASGIGLFIAEYSLGILGILLPLILLMIGTGSIVPLATSGAMKQFPQMAGSAAALTATSMYLISGISTALIAKLKEDSAHILFMTMMVMAILTLAISLMTRENGRKHV